MSLVQWKQGLERYFYRLRRKQNTSEQLVGLDLGPGFVKLLKIDNQVSPYSVESFNLLALPPGAIAKEEIKDVAVVSNALMQVLDQAQVNTKNIALAIPRSSAIIKTIMVNRKLNAADIESRAWVEANHLFPDLVGDIYLDFDIIGPSTQDPTQLDLLLVACRKDQIKPYLDLLEGNGLNVRVVDVNCYAFERALSLLVQKMPELQTVALLNLDFSMSSLIVVSEKQMIYAHDHSYEGLHFKNQVQKFLDTQQDKKGAYKSLAQAAEYLDLLKAGLSAHLRHSMHFFYSSRPHIAIQKLFLAGDCASIPHLSTFIQQETGIETIVADPFLGMELASSVDQVKLKQYSSALILCCGLALSKLKETEF